MSTPSLTDFLLARIAEDEAAAEPIQNFAGPEGYYGKKTLAECEAKRRIVEIHPHVFAESDGRFIGDSWSCQKCHDGNTDWWCTTLRLLALPYADHPDYEESWRP